MATKKVLSFEDKMNRLDEITKKMETETLPLEEALKLFEEAQKLIIDLEANLEEARGKVAKYIE